jgi:Na+-driven multidrug efflux pump
MMVCLEWWLFELANMLSGVLPHPESALAVTGICTQVIVIAFMVPLGICSGLRIRVANLLGMLHEYICCTLALLLEVSLAQHVP